MRRYLVICGFLRYLGMLYLLLPESKPSRRLVGFFGLGVFYWLLPESKQSRRVVGLRLPFYGLSLLFHCNFFGNSSRSHWSSTS